MKINEMILELRNIFPKADKNGEIFLNEEQIQMFDYKTLIKLIEKYDEEALRVFNKLKKSDQEAETYILYYGHYSYFKRLEWEYSDENSISVVYYHHGYDIYETECLSIPADILFDDEKIDKWIKSEVDKALEEKEEQRIAKEKYQEEKERQMYETLKQKYGGAETDNNIGRIRLT